MTEAAIIVSDVWKRFRIYHERVHSLKDMMLATRTSSYDELWALQGVSFEVQRGETVGIIGENGSGKSTMLKVIARILRPQTGLVETRGRVSALIELGAGFHPDLTGSENVYLNGSILGMTRVEIDERFSQIVEFSGLGEFIDQPVRNYSSGMYLRLGFSVAVAVDPDILLVDEILSVGDEAFQRKSANRIMELQSMDRTIVVVSHDLNAIRNVCNKAIWLDDGKVRAIGQTKPVIDAYIAEVNRQEVEASGAAPAGAQAGDRRGTLEARITGVEFVDTRGQKREQFSSGEPLVARISYEADRPIEKPVFGVGIHTSEGCRLTSPNTKGYQMDIPAISGRGVMEYRVDSLPLLPGYYLFSAALTDYSLLHPYDHQDKMYGFSVTSGPAVDPAGAVHIPCQWRFLPGGGNAVG